MSSPNDSVSRMELGKWKIKQNEFKSAEKAFMDEVKHFTTLVFVERDYIE